MTGEKAVEMVTLKIDGRAITVPKGTNVIEAARSAGIEIPHYCYHPHLSIAGNCRMCQVEIKGRPKLEIACNMTATEGLEIATHLTSKVVKDTQAATLEFILINHPLDCTVCDQAGHCKLQDYHYEYNARPSRFLENKEHKVKAEPLGPHVILDGERCIMCTRCIRFCDEVTGTSELGMLNRGDKSVISITPGKPLDNALSGTVVDLCPVGALTHRDWRFNTRMWFTKQADGICPGCSTGCNVKVASRDGQVVQVKARPNDNVNKEWLCDEGRYGFGRFLPKSRVTSSHSKGAPVTLDAALAEATKIKSGDTVIFVGADLLVEDYSVLKNFKEKFLPNATIALAYKERKLTNVEAILVSPDYAANFRGAEFAGIVSGNLEAGYQDALRNLGDGKFKNVLVIGDRAILSSDVNVHVLHGLAKADMSVGILCDAESPLIESLRVVIPGRSILEKSGLLINRAERLQYTDRLIDFAPGTEPEWRILSRIGERLGGKLTNAQSDREMTLSVLSSDSRLQGLSIGMIKDGGVRLKTYKPGAHVESSASAAT